MQTITITLTVPDGVQFAVNTVTDPPAAVHCAVNPPVVVNDGPTLEELKRAFLATVNAHGKDKAFAALGCAKCVDVPAGEYGAAIERLKAVQ